VRVGIEDNLCGRKGERRTSVEQIEQMVRIAREIGRDFATSPEARRIYQLDTCRQNTDETLRQLGMTPDREPGQRGVPFRFAS
jgi:hypothetical protein